MRKRFVPWLMTVVAVLSPAASPSRAHAGGTASEEAARAAVAGVIDRDDLRNARLEWPAIPDVDPPEGAEAVLVEDRGSLESWRLTRFVVRGRRVETRSMTWHGNRWGDGPTFTADAFDGSWHEFRTAWNAARRLHGVRALWIEEPGPEYVDDGRRYVCGLTVGGSHHAIRLRDGPDTAPWHVTPPHGRAPPGVPRWPYTVNPAVAEVFRRLLNQESRTHADVGDWPEWCAKEVAAAAPVLVTDFGHLHGELLPPCLQIIGEFGGPETAACVAALTDALRVRYLTESSETIWLAHYAPKAAARLRLRHAFDAAEAARLLTDPDPPIESDWVRRRWAAAAPESLLSFARERLAVPRTTVPDRVAGLHDLAACPGDEPARVAREFLGPRHATAVRTAAAALILARDRRDGEALEWMLSSPRGEGRYLLEPEHVVRAALSSGKEDGRWMWIANSLPISSGHRFEGGDEGRIAAWRRALAQPEHPGTRFAVKALLENSDVPSLGRIEALLDRWTLDAAARAASGISDDELEALRVRMAELRSPPDAVEKSPPGPK